MVLLLMWLDHALGRPAIWGRPGVVLIVVLAALAPLSAEELRRMIPAGPQRPNALTVWIAAWLAVMPAALATLFAGPAAGNGLDTHGWGVLGWAAAASWVFLLEMWAYQDERQTLERIRHTLFIAIYIGLLSFLPYLRLFGGNSWGLVALLSLVVTVKMSDSFAYLIGRALGRHKMTPVLSPGKTIEGGIAGIVFGMLGALLSLFPIATWITGSSGRTTLTGALIFGAIVALAGVCGDLAESLIKRESHVKDSGDLIPGMGGMLDVVDSLMGAAPMAFALWAVGWVGP